MPIYEYQCSDCDHAFDELQKMDAEPLVECPECALKTLVKLVSAPSFRLKGSGWYETDFKQDKRRNLADAGNDSAPSAKKESTSKNESAGKSDSGSSKSESTSNTSSTSKSSSTSAKQPTSKSAD